MPLSFICHRCEELAVEAKTAIRSHARQVELAIDPGRRSRRARVDQEYLRDRILASFREAQSAWDCYREHLSKHGVVPTVCSKRVAA